MCAVWSCIISRLNNVCTNAVSLGLQHGIGIAAPWDFKGLPTDRGGSGSNELPTPLYGKMPSKDDIRYLRFEHNLTAYVRPNYRASTEGKQETIPPQPPIPRSLAPPLAPPLRCFGWQPGH